MKKNYLFVFKLRKNFLSIVFLLFTICLVLFSSKNMQATKSGLKLWANSVVPSLLPFFIATELLSYTNIPDIFQKFCNPIMKPFFNISGRGAFAIIMGWLSGYPVGAKIAVNFRNNNICSKEDCERLLSFTNNSGPLFIIGTSGISLFGNSMIGFLLLFTHLLGSLTVGYLFKFWKKSSNTFVNYPTSHLENKLQNVSFSNLGEVLSNSIKSAINTILMIGGFVILFSVIISIINSSRLITIINLIFTPICIKFNIPSQLISSFFTGILEITNGINLISNINIKNISIKIIITSFLLGLGGLSVFLQVLSIVSKSDLSIKPYILGKILHAFISAFYTFIIINMFPIFNFNLAS